MTKLTKKIKNKYPVYLKKMLPGTAIVLSHVMVIENNRSIYVSSSLEQIEKTPLNELYYILERGMVKSTKEEFDDAFIEVSMSLLKEAGTHDQVNINQLKNFNQNGRFIEDYRKTIA